MDKAELIEYALAKQGAYLDFPFAQDYAAVKVRKSQDGKGRIFAEIFTLSDRDTLTFSADCDTAAYLREKFPSSIARGWHCSPVQAKYKSSAVIADFDGETLKGFIDISYSRALSKL